MNHTLRDSFHIGETVYIEKGKYENPEYEGVGVVDGYLGEYVQCQTIKLGGRNFHPTRLRKISNVEAIEKRRVEMAEQIVLLQKELKEKFDEVNTKLFNVLEYLMREPIIH